MRWPPVVIATAATAAAGASAVALVGVARTTLAAWRPATCLPADCFCEAVRPEGLAQPVNTLTSLGYVLLGLWALAGGVRRPDGDRHTAALMSAVGVALALLGLGSTSYHGTVTFVGQVLDVAGMYLLGTLLTVGALVRRRALASASTPFRVGLGLLATAYLLWVLDATGVLCDPTSPWQGHGAWHLLTAASAVLVVGHYARTTRRRKGTG